MEEDAIPAQAYKFTRVGNGRNDSNKIGSRGSGGGGAGGGDVSSNRFEGWHHHSSRIIRVSRASGGKDRHSKVMTSKGLRDRRVRLSVTTAIQFYDLQDRLGYDQPSKAVEWLIKAASDAISELPFLNNTFPDKQPSDEKRGTEQGFDDTDDHAEVNADDGDYHQTQSQNLSLSKSACSSTSETSKGSGLSLSRSDIRVNREKARERARERAAKEKEKENTAHPHNNVNNPISQTASFTELLTGGVTSTVNPSTTTSPAGDDHEPDLFNKAARQQWCTTTPMDYFNSGLVGHHSIRSHNNNNQSSGLFAGQSQLGNSNSLPLQASPFNVGSENHSDQLQHFSLSTMPDHHLIPSGSCSDYNLNFTISSSSSSSGFAGFNRGTLQSNSPSVLPHPLQRFSSSLDGSNLPFFIGAAAVPTMENHHHHQFSSPGFDGRLQLCYGDLTRHSDHNKGKGKN
ncbi:hypothetical protein QN277_020494 [Acacia crassicarpa]|uniref:Transcription factor TCP2-like n=1 Tax=Acacia crassicarpa TaxID=499986 RepID=A0AAE1KD67_9FABA|nr:hypothetical protein QN277_020494 [Acacia crassicarpa]